MATPAEFQQVLTQALTEAREQSPQPQLGGVAIAWPSAIGLSGEPTHYDNYHKDFTNQEFSLRSIVRVAVEDAGFEFVASRCDAAKVTSRVDVINDADADLLYEARWGVAQNVSNAIGVKLCGGIGGSVLIDGQLLEGASGRAGEIEHVPVRYENVKMKHEWDHLKKLEDLDACWCNGKACIERFASGRAIIDTLEDYETRADDYNERGVLIEKDAADKRVQEVFERAGLLLGLALHGPILALDPECVVITAFPRNDSLLDGLRQNLPDPRVRSMLSTPGGWTTAAGAARLVIEQRMIPRIEKTVLPRPRKNPVRRRDLPAWLRRVLPENNDVLQDTTRLYRPSAGK